MGCARRRYQPRQAEASVLHGVIRDHLDGSLRAAADRAHGAGLPEFIAREFREFLTCGVLAPHARWRAELVADRRTEGVGAIGPSGERASLRIVDSGTERLHYWTWAALMRRAFDLDVLRYPLCAGRMRRIATIDDPVVILWPW